MKHTVYIGDVVKALKLLPDNSVDMCITSPPYLYLRSYGHDGQIGLEPTIDDYLKKMLEVTIEVKRIIKKSGSFWVNMGDCFASSGLEKSRFCHGDNQGKHKLSEGNFSGHCRQENYQAKCLLMMPERLAMAMIDRQGWILRNKIKWCKQVLIVKQNITIGSAMPASVNDRFNETGEELYFFTKNKKYYFALDKVRIPCQVQGVTDLRLDGFTRSREYGYDSKYDADYSPLGKQSGQRGNSFNYRVRDAERKEGQPQFNASKEEISNYKGKFEEKEDAEGYNSPRARTQRDTTKNAGRDSQGHRGKDGKGMFIVDRYNSPKGRNIPSIWQINSEPHNYKKELGVDVDHFAAFPSALVYTPIIASCPEGGTVLDIFWGTGTTSVVAEGLNMNSIGIEINPDYVEIGNRRLLKLNSLVYKVEIEKIILE